MTILVFFSLVEKTTTSTASVTDASMECLSNNGNDRISSANVRLDNFNESSFNDANSNLRIMLDCPILDQDNYTILINGDVTSNTTSTNDSITLLNLLSSSSSVISVFALDQFGLPIFASFQIYTGSLSMPVQVFFSNGSKAGGVTVTISLTDNSRISQTGVTNENGTIVFVNVPFLTVSIFAHTKDNQIGLAGIAPSNMITKLILIPFNSATSRNQEIGHQSYLNVTTWGQTLQTISRTFSTAANTNEVFIEYQFITSEVPGGYFGSVFNDYYSVTLRSETGKYVTRVESMNSLGLGAFDYTTGATRWNNLTMKTGSSPEQIRFDVGVSNVADAAFQSSVLVRRYGSNQCAACTQECTECTSDPMCRDVCTNPPTRSCAFYLNCMEEKISCGSTGYALNYGRKNCIKFSSVVNRFTTFGQAWIWNTMNCLQKALVMPLKDCQGNCSALYQAAFHSHPQCYIDNGFCNMSIFDIATVVTTVGKDLFTFDGFIQAIKTGPQCLPTILNKIDQELQQQTATEYKIILVTLQKLFRSL